MTNVMHIDNVIKKVYISVKKRCCLFYYRVLVAKNLAKILNQRFFKEDRDVN